jgi:hypothetical protein
MLKMYICPHVRYSRHTLIKRQFFRQIFEKYSNIRFHENTSQWKPSCSMRTDGQRERRADMTKLIVAFRNFANAPKTAEGRK